MSSRSFWRSTAPVVALTILVLVPILVLYGWATNNLILTRVIPVLTPMNPVTACCFLLIAATLIVDRLIEGRRTCAVVRYVSGTVIFVVGIVMLFKYTAGIDVYIDRIFFAANLGVNRMAVTTSFIWFLIGICLLLRNRIRTILPLFYAVTFGVAAYAFIAYLYNFSGIYGQTLFNPMALHTALLFMVLAAYMLGREQRSVRRSITFLQNRHLYTPTLVVLVFCLTLTITTGFAILTAANATRQATQRFESHTEEITSSIASKIHTYVNVNQGIRGLFAASQSVQESEWQEYMKKLDVQTTYTGISALLFAKKVLPADVSKLPFTVHPVHTDTYYLPITYITTFPATTSTSIGFDYRSDPLRRAVIDQAVQEGAPRATPVVLSPTTKLPLFSVYFPIYTNGADVRTPSARLASLEGIGSIAFRLNTVFPDLIDRNPLVDKTLSITITDSTDKTQLYLRKGELLGTHKPDLTHFDFVTVAGRTWIITYDSTVALNEVTEERLSPYVTGIAGLLLALLLSYLTYAYIRSRERALSARNTQLRSVVDQMPLGFMLEDEKRHALYVNKHMFDLFVPGNTLSVREVVGVDTRDLAKRVQSIVPDFAAYTARIEAIVAAQQPVYDEKIQLEGERFIARDYVPLIDNGRHIGGMWTFKDITEIETIDRMKTEFVSLASHQLRTPLTSIKWYSELLLDESGKLSEEQHEYAIQIQEASNRMNDLVAALLDVSRLELGTFMINPVLADLLATVQSAVDEQLPTFAQKKQKFSFEHPATLPPISIDPKLVFIIVQNLISNAHKYTPDGGTITLAIRAETDGSHTINCTDTGYGIPRAEQNSVFKKLFRADNIRTLDVEGTGLGLYMIKTIVDAAACSIHFVSEEGKGTTFTVRIPKEGMAKKSGTRELSGEESA